MHVYQQRDYLLPANIAKLMFVLFCSLVFMLNEIDCIVKNLLCEIMDLALSKYRYVALLKLPSI